MEKFQLLIIGNAERSLSFKKKYGWDLEIDWHFNGKAWMNRHTFFEWLQRLDLHFRDNFERNILLSIDKCSALGRIGVLYVSQNARVDFLPPSISRKIPPPDAEIVARVKRKYKRRIILRVFHNIERCSEKIFNVDVLTVVR